MQETNTDTRKFSKPKKSCLEKLEAQLSDWDAELDHIKANTKTLRADARAELDNQIAGLQKKRSKVASRLQDIRDGDEHAWEDLKTGAEKAWNELVKTTESLASRCR